MRHNPTTLYAVIASPGSLSSSPPRPRQAIEPGELFTGQLIKLTIMVEKLRTTLVNELPSASAKPPATRDLASVCQELHTATGYLRRTIEGGPELGLEAKLQSAVGAQKSLAQVFEDGEYVIRWPDDYERTITAESIECARRAAASSGPASTTGSAR